MYDFLKIFFFSKKVIYLKLFKKNSLCKKIHSLRQTHSVKHEFYFQFRFATNEPV